MFTEFFCDAANGSNMNGGGVADGSEPTAAAKYSATNGGWNSGTGVFTPTSGDPSASVSVGDWAHVFADGGTTPTFIARVTAVNSTTITVSTTAKSGTAPGTAGTGISINVGGRWKGPNGTSGFPFGFITNAQTDASGNLARVNFKNNATYSVTAAMTHNLAGPAVFQGYTTTAGDGGKATIDGGTSGASYTLLTASGNYNCYADLIFQNNGATGTGMGVNGSAGSSVNFERCVFTGFRGEGLRSGNVWASECEFYACNASNTATLGAVNVSGSGVFVRCVFHDNAGSNANGAYVGGTMATFIDCIFDTNGRYGIQVNTANVVIVCAGCTFYGNATSGVNLAISATCVALFDSCLFVGNTTTGLAAGSGTAARMVNCAFYNNGSATGGVGNVNASGAVTLTGDPFTGAAAGDFSLNNTAGAGAACRGAGRGSFTMAASGYGDAVSYPDIGAAEAQATAGGGGSKFF